MAQAQKSARGARENLAIRPVESVVSDLEAMQQRIMNRAFELFEERGRAAGREIEDWLAAERELTWQPLIELTEEDGTLTLEAEVAGFEPADLDVQATSEDILIRSDRTHRDREGVHVHCCEFCQGRLFRDIRLPSRIDPDRARAAYKNGVLHITAPIVEESVAGEIPVPTE